MKINITNGLVSVEYSKQSPERIKALLAELQSKYEIKNKAELAKIFGVKSKDPARHLRAWCSPEEAKTHQPMPKLSYELLLRLTENTDIEVNHGR